MYTRKAHLRLLETPKFDSFETAVNYIQKDTERHRERMLKEWREKGMFESTEQRVCGQARAIINNGWLSKLELEAINRQVEDESQGDVCREQDVTVEAETVENDAGRAEQEMNDAEDSIGAKEGDLSEEH